MFNLCTSQLRRGSWRQRMVRNPCTSHLKKIGYIPQKKCICTSRQSALSCLHISYCTLLHPIKYNISAQHLFDCVSFICQPQKIKNKSDHFEWPSIWEQAKELKKRRRRVAFMMPCICICICFYICICICIWEKMEDSLVTFMMLDPQIQWLSVPKR